MRTLVVVLLSATLAQGASIDVLRAANPPHFRPGHTLAPLSRWGWSLPFDVRVELCERWGYALEFGGYVGDAQLKALDQPDSVEARLVALTNKDPKRYPLAVLTQHSFGKDVPDTAWAHDADGKLPGGQRIWSPAAPESIFMRAGEQWAAPLRALRRRVPLALVLNGGEYGTSVYGFGGRAWDADPQVRAARGDRGWLEYLSSAKARQEEPIAAAFRQAVPDRLLYVFYTCSVCPHRNRYNTWWHWAYDYEPLRGISDIASAEVYYKSFNDGWVGQNDLLTMFLNSVGGQLAFGDKLAYNWLCAGWRQDKKRDADVISDPERYMGFLKCVYTTGQIGAVAGYFSVPKEDDPNWLWQMTELSHAHALFSWLEDYLRQGDLLPGPDRHRFSQDQPAYEFPTGDKEARVLARKLAKQAKWLVTAWAAAGDAREVSVTVPELGTIKVLARPGGSVYRAQVGRLELVDTDALEPTKSM